MGLQDVKKVSSLEVIGNEDPFVLVYVKEEDKNYAVSKSKILELRLYNGGDGALRLIGQERVNARRFDTIFYGLYSFENILTDGIYITA